MAKFADEHDAASADESGEAVALLGGPGCRLAASTAATGPRPEEMSMIAGLAPVPPLSGPPLLHFLTQIVLLLGLAVALGWLAVRLGTAIVGELLAGVHPRPIRARPSPTAGGGMADPARQQPASPGGRGRPDRCAAAGRRHGCAGGH